MNKEFYAGNRKSLYQKLEAGSLVVVFSGHAPIKTNDENYPFFTNRNFLYLTGIEQENIVLMAYVGEGTILAMLRKFILILTRFMKIRRQ